MSDDATPSSEAETPKLSLTGWTQEDLNQATCAEPGCTTKGHHHGPLVLNGRCHPKAAVIARYCWGGYLEARCKIENKFICRIFVSPEEQEVRDRQIVEQCPDNPGCTRPPQDHSAILRGCAEHRGAGVYVTYYNGNLTIACARCKNAIDTMHVKHAAGQA